MNYESIIVDARRLLSEVRKLKMEQSGKDIDKDNYIWLLNPNTWDEIVKTWEMVAKNKKMINESNIFGINYRFADLPDGIIILQEKGGYNEK